MIYQKEPKEELKAAWVASRAQVGISDIRPVRANSWMDGPGEARCIEPTSGDFPGWAYGDRVFTPERQPREPHSHHYYEINIVRSGKAMHVTKSTADELGPGMVVVMAPGQVHSIYGIESLHQTNVYYHAEWASDDLTALWEKEGLVSAFLAAALFPNVASPIIPQFQLTPEELSSIDYELADIGSETHQAEPSRMLLKLSLLKLLIKLSRVYAREAGEEMIPTYRKELIEAISRIEDVILQCETLDVAALAGEVGVSASYFATLFRSATGHSPMDYYQHRRVQHACRLLLDRSLSITDIAQMLGYYDSAHLCHFFKRYRKMTPRAYRKNFWE